MKEVKYIPLDLVKADKSPNIIWKVKDVSQDKRGNVLYRVVAAEDNDAFIYLYEHQIAPVPLTPEILEKNGWGKDYCIGNEDRYVKYDFLYISYYRNDNTTKLFVKGLTLLSNIKYVHQLQHLLFGLGLSMNLKV